MTINYTIHIQDNKIMQGLQISFNNVSIQDKQYLMEYWSCYFDLQDCDKTLWEIKDNGDYLLVTIYDDLVWSIPLSAFRFGFALFPYTVKKVDSLTLHTFAKGVQQRSHRGSYITFDFIVAKIKSWFN